MPESYREFFSKVTGKEILPYQERYGRNPFASTLLVVPTGLGKTDSVLLPWLYAQASNDPAVPTRLIIVLPRQNLTLQTAKNARMRVSAAGLADRVRVLELMAGSDDNDETLRPDCTAIIVCTQDMYFSRALNRGYARRPPRWPIDFALYNQDCLIVHDEIQLMDDALATSRQLAAFRTEFKTYGDAPSIWMSATVNTDWLRTVDSRNIPPCIQLEDDDLGAPVVMRRLHALKQLAPAPPECREPKACAAFALARHRKGTRTIIIANTVPRAREIYVTIRAEFPGANLIHSRFRPRDRKRAAQVLLAAIPEEGQIVVSTQVLEAGVDITSRLLITDIAPWGSLVQRFGRVNRYGDDEDAEIWWVDQPTYAKQKDPTAPYTEDEIRRAVERITPLTSASPAGLPQEDGPEPWQHVLRRADLLDLFDTTSDLTGNQMDVSRFIRATDDKDAYLAWRDWEGDGTPPDSLAELADEELCPVPFGELREFMKKRWVYTWNFATEKWTQADKDRLYAGMRAVARASEGGYTEREGWSPESKAKVEPLSPGTDEAEGDSSDPKTYQNYRQTLRDHTQRVVEEMEVLLDGQKLDPLHIDAIRTAAAKHDWGKSHAVFQKTLHKNDDSPDLLAKQFKTNARHERKHFRHELASALAMLDAGDSDLAAYLAAAHHGRVRLGIRSMPGETEKDEIRTARGIHDGDHLPGCELALGLSVPAVQLSLAVMDFGADGRSWTDRMLRLRDEIGPFRLAYLEVLLRAADEEASANPKLEARPCTP
jgi:CRISPR-associated endonuclease/helicase Cas3